MPLTKKMLHIPPNLTPLAMGLPLAKCTEIYSERPNGPSRRKQNEGNSLSQGWSVPLITSQTCEQAKMSSPEHLSATDPHGCKAGSSKYTLIYTTYLVGLLHRIIGAIDSLIQ